MRALEWSLQAFGEFILRRQLVRPTAAPYFVRWVRRFLSGSATNKPLADQVRRFCQGLQPNKVADWQGRQAEQVLRLYFPDFPQTDWCRSPNSTVIDGGRTDVLAALHAMRERLRTCGRAPASCPWSTAVQNMVTAGGRTTVCRRPYVRNFSVQSGPVRHGLRYAPVSEKCL